MTPAYGRILLFLPTFRISKKYHARTLNGKSAMFKTESLRMSLQWPIFALFNPLSSQRSLYVPHSGHCMYRTAVTICTAQRSLYVPHSGHYMYRTVVTVCTARRSLYVPHSGHYMYRIVVTICTAQWSLYVPPVQNSQFYVLPNGEFMCFVWISEQTVIILGWFVV